MKNSPSIGEYLIQRLYAHGVRHVFGIPGDYVLGVYDQLFKTGTLLVTGVDGAQFAFEELVVKPQHVITRYPEHMPHPVRVETLDQVFADRRYGFHLAQKVTMPLNQGQSKPR